MENDMAKKYYWLKLKDNFFNQKEIKKLRKIAGGDTFTIIYLKMQLLSIKKDGIITFEGTERDLAEQLSLEIDEDIDNIQVTLSFLIANNLIEELEEDNYLLPKVVECIGKEGASAERVRRHRQRKALQQEEQQKLLQCNGEALQCNGEVLQCNGEVTKCNTEKEKEKEKEKEIKKDIYKEKKSTKEFISLEFIDDSIDKVNLTQQQYDKLCLKFSTIEVDKKILALDNYLSNGKKYKDHYKTINNWCLKDVKSKPTTNNPIPKAEPSKTKIDNDFINKLGDDF